MCPRGGCGTAAQVGRLWIALLLHANFHARLNVAYFSLDCQCAFLRQENRCASGGCEHLSTLPLKKRRDDAVVTKTSLVDSAYAALKSAILQNVYPPGFQAAESDVATQLGMSRTPVHEAMIRLQEEGLVEILPRRGILIKAISLDDIREVYELAIALESMAAEIMASRPSADLDAVVAMLEAETAAMEAALEADDLDSWAAADGRFHELLTDGCGNRRLARMAAAVRDQSHRARLVTLRLRPLPAQSAPEHYAIIAAIKARDFSAAAENAAAHRRHAREELLPLLAKLGVANL